MRQRPSFLRSHEFYVFSPNKFDCKQTVSVYSRIECDFEMFIFEKKSACYCHILISFTTIRFIEFSVQATYLTQFIYGKTFFSQPSTQCEGFVEQLGCSKPYGAQKQQGLFSTFSSQRTDHWRIPDAYQILIAQLQLALFAHRASTLSRTIIT